MELDVNARSKVGRTPLHDAVTIGHVDVVEILLENQANPNCVARTDELASFDAISDGVADMVDLVNSSTTVTPLELACYQKKIDMMKVYGVSNYCRGLSSFSQCIINNY